MIVEQAIQFVKEELANNDSSHDWLHIERVLINSRKIAENEPKCDTEIVELGAIFHDIGDWKYSGSTEAGPLKVRTFLESVEYPEERICRILEIVRGVGFSHELESSGHAQSLELNIVQDADRLDGSGAVGVARAFAYGSRKGDPFYDRDIEYRACMTASEYRSNVKTTTINHFYEKLLKLKGMMKTATGRELAKDRHEFMVQFLAQFYKDIGW